MNTPKVLVSIVHYRVPELLERCLASFREHPPSIPYRVVVADNSANESSIRSGIDKFSYVELLEMESNLGFSAANNRAVEGAKEEFLFFLNPDTEVREGTLEKLVDRMESDPSIAAVGPLNRGSDGEVQFSCRTFPGYATFLGHRYSVLTRLFPSNRYSQKYLQSNLSPEEPREVDWISGAAMMVRRSDFEAVRGFDETFFMYSEDVDLCYRFHQRGKKIYYEPAANIVHHLGSSSGRNRFRALWERHRSMYTFYKKHYSLEIPLIDFMTVLGITLRGILHLGLEAAGRSPHR
jgi:GT2 family glycosyltransferase